MKEPVVELNSKNVFNMVRPFQISQVFIITRQKPYECIEYGEHVAQFSSFHHHENIYTREKVYECKHLCYGVLTILHNLNSTRANDKNVIKLLLHQGQKSYSEPNV